MLTSLLNWEPASDKNSREEQELLEALRRFQPEKKEEIERWSGSFDNYMKALREKVKFSELERDVEDVASGVELNLIPACDGSPPIPLRTAQRRLYGAFPEADDQKLRRLALRVLLSLEGADLMMVVDILVDTCFKTISFEKGLKIRESMKRRTTRGRNQMGGQKAKPPSKSK